MLSISQKESILRKAGVIVQPFPIRRLPHQARFDRCDDNYPKDELRADQELELEVTEWRGGVEALYLAWLASR